nr:hypothetical protein BJQ95_03595 [Cryobacterium sp. SO1]
MEATIARPRPLPPVSLALEVSARQKRWKILSRICGGMPSPWSMTEMEARWLRRSTATSSSTGLSAGLNRRALPIRLVMTWRTLFSSAMITASSSGGASTAGGASLAGRTASVRLGRRVRSLARVAPAKEIVPVLDPDGSALGAALLAAALFVAALVALAPLTAGAGAGDTGAGVTSPVECARSMGASCAFSVNSAG